MKLERLDRPPIAEVVCGIAFESIPRLDPVTIGAYSRDRTEEYPTHDLHPLLADGGEIFIGPSPVRVWLVSHDDQFVLQIQHDRFYLNWRRRDAEYPRFNDYDGNPGLLSKALTEFDAFTRFCLQTFATAPRPTRIELAKVDHFVEGEHWRGMDDVAVMVPALRPTFELLRSREPQMLGLQFGEQSEAGRVTASFGTLLRADKRRAVSLETRVVAAASPDQLRAAFVAANDELNELFGRIIPEQQRKRFTRGT